jgi:hypothetical protein
MDYWAIAPWENADTQIFDQVWRYDRDHGTIAIRWAEVGDVSKLSRSEIGKRVQEVYGPVSGAAEQMLFDFYNKIKVGDVVVARRGLKHWVGIGKVIRAAYHDLPQGQVRMNGLGSQYMGVHFIDIHWERRGMIPVRESFTVKVLSNIGEAKYQRISGR